MASTYPGTLDNFTNPSGTSALSDPDHALQHSNANDAIEALETKLGLGAATPDIGKLLIGSGSGTSTWLASGTSGQYLKTQGTAGNPVWANAPRNTITVARDGSGDYNCDGTDDQIEIWAAINALQSTGGMIFLKEGTYNISYTGLNVWHDNIRFSGAGNATIIRLNDVASAETFFITSKSNIILENFQIDGNKAGQSAAGNGIIIDSCTNIRIRNLYIKDTYKSGITIQKSEVTTPLYIWIDDCLILNPNNQGIVATNASAYHVHGNTVYNSDTNAGIILYACNNFTVGGNNVNNTGGGYAGVRCAETCYSGAIFGNSLVGCDRGVVLTSSSNKIAVTGNSVYFSNFGGIIVEDGCAVNTVSGNVCRENGQSGTATPDRDGIYIADASSNVITGNVCIDSQGTPTQQYGIRETGSSNYNVIIGNSCRGNAVANLSVTGANTLYQAGTAPLNLTS